MSPRGRSWITRDVELGFRAPLWPDSLFGHLAATAVPGVEEWSGGAYRRTLRLPHGVGIVALTPPASAVVCCRLLLSDRRDADAAVATARQLLDLDADPVAVDGVLRRDPALAPLVSAAPGRRIPGAPGPAELAVRAVLGQQVSTAAARTHAARLVLAHGEPVSDPEGGLTHLFPSVCALTGLDPAALALPASRRATLIGLVAALAGGSIDLTAPFAEVERQLVALPGIGPWTARTVTMRALGDGDAFLPTDLGIVLAAKGLGLPSTPGALTRHAEAWRPYRAYAVQYLWGSGTHAVNHLPT